MAQIDEDTFTDLSTAISEEAEGYVQGIVAKVNEALAKYLDFPRWWAQDRDFR